MILLDTGPLVALFDKQDAYHAHCKAILHGLKKPLLTTTPVLTKAFHLLGINTKGSQALRDFVAQGGTNVWFFDNQSLQMAFRLMEKYQDCPMDFADASLVTAAQQLGLYEVFTIDRKDFFVYRLEQGHEHRAFTVIG
jgi:predicted nucleic acid-binding protein